MGNKLARIGDDGHIRFPNSHSRRIIVFMPDYPTADHGMFAIEGCQGRKFLVDKSFLAVVAFGFKVPARRVERDVGCP